MESTAEVPLGLGDMPAEVIDRILGLLDNVDFCACAAASRLWHVYSPADYARRIVASRGWSGPLDLLETGNATAVRGLVALGRMDLADYESAPFLAAHRGHLGLIIALHELDAPGFDSAPGVMDCAVDDGHLDIAIFLHGHRKGGCTTYAMNRAAAHGRLDLVDFLHRNRREGCTRRAMDYAAANGHFDVVVYLHENRTEGCSVGAVNRAAANGHRDVVAYLLAHRTEGSTPLALATAAANGDVGMLRTLTEDCPTVQPGDRRAMDAAAANGHLDAVAYLDEKRTEGCTGRAIVDAADGGHFDVVLFLLDHRLADCVEGLHRAADAALAHGRMDVAERIWARSTMRYTPSMSVFIGAARGGHTAVLSMLRKHHRATFDEYIDDMTFAAVANGHVGAARFCINHAPQSTATGHQPADIVRARHRKGRIRDAVEFAAAAGHVQVIGEVDSVLYDATESYLDGILTAAASNGHLPVIDLVLRRRPYVRLGECVVQAAAAAGHTAILDHLLERPHWHGPPAGLVRAAIDAAAGAGHNHILEWLSRRPDVGPSAWRSSSAVDEAFAGGHVSTLRLLRDPAFGQRAGYHSVADKSNNNNDDGDGKDTDNTGDGDAARSRANGLPEPMHWSWERAARHGHLAAISYLYAEGIRADCWFRTMTEAILGDHLAVVKFVYRTMPSHDPSSVLGVAHKHRRYRIAQWLDDAIQHGAYRPPQPPPPARDDLTQECRFIWGVRRTGKSALMAQMLGHIYGPRGDDDNRSLVVFSGPLHAAFNSDHRDTTQQSAETDASLPSRMDEVD
ncbi:Ankyrin repeat domain containing protein [Pandoravirus quercus]|uniref:Ankyrin repeat domain containing protein n=1 Tax=Pandoravirus quercus TaxID=2107709 RepID=A0A2U7U8K4_9VIRU|nr:Ankyrin repeat domain containing protein [Pandoravirus quercus]AVK74778.1 Ankyrin repeat domain containing protein [Pandoravirus quercus]